MNTYLKKSIVFVLSLGIFACEETYIFDEQDAPSALVVEGFLTNELGTHHYVKLSETVGFYTRGKTPRISNAVVTLSNSQGDSLQWAEDPENAGFYHPLTAFAGEIGEFYTLTALLPTGETLTASDTLRRVTPIDSLVWQIDEDEQEDPDDHGFFYDVLLFTKEPQETIDYYLFKTYRNGQIMTNDGQSILYADDEIVGETIDDVQINPDPFALGDTCTFEMYSIGVNVFTFYDDAQSILDNDGGMFGPVPANAFSNVTNSGSKDVMGAFQIGAVVRDSIIIGF